MRIILSDKEIKAEKDDMLIAYDESIHSCRGCFNCWLKTPGECGITDGYRNMGRRLSMGDELVIVSRCLFGGYSPFVKNVLDRSISYVQPFFDTSAGDMRHKRRYSNKLKLKVIFYGDADEISKETAKKLVAANARNLRAEVGEIYFVDNDELVGVEI